MPTDIHTFQLPRASRTYFFDIAKSSKGFYLRMSCSEKSRIGFDHHRIFVFEEDLADFVTALNKSAAEMMLRKKKAGV